MTVVVVVVVVLPSPAGAGSLLELGEGRGTMAVAEGLAIMTESLCLKAGCSVRIGGACVCCAEDQGGQKQGRTTVR